MSSKLAERMFDAGVRCEQMYWIGGVCAEPPANFVDYLQDDLADDKEILAQLPFLANVAGKDWPAEDILAEFAMRDVDGFFVQLATPVPSDFMKGEGGGYSYSWGHYRTKWFFCQSLDQIVNRAEEWQKSVVEAARAKAAA